MFACIWNQEIKINTDITGFLDIKVIILSEVSERQISHDISYVESKKMIQMNLLTKQKQTHRHRRQTYDYLRGREGRDKLEVRD